MQAVALDCEMVGSGSNNLLASVSVVDINGQTLLHEYVKPTASVTDYRTFLLGDGIQRRMENGQSIAYVRDKVSKLLSYKILVGHSLHFDLKALGLHHPESDRRDLAKYGPFMKNGQPQSLKTLARLYLNDHVQEGAHDSLEDARIAMRLYKLVRHQW